MHVISASRRTDIPAFHAEWFMERVRVGSVGVVLPFNGKILDVSLDPADVIAIVFWTKNATPLIPYLDELTDRGHCFNFIFTINNYPISVEPRVPQLSHTLDTVEWLIRRYSTPIFRWRYDTIVMTNVLDRKWHVRNFSYLCRHLSGYTTECIFSFCDYYKKTIKNMYRALPDFHIPDKEESKSIAEELADIAEHWGIKLASCAHDFLVSEKIKKARCIDPEVLYKVVDTPERRLAVRDLKSVPTRRECNCAASKDIGAYDTCLHGCIYCYANSSPDLAARNVERITRNSYCLDPKGSRMRTPQHKKTFVCA